VAEGLNWKCCFEDFITIDVDVHYQCIESLEFDRSEANEETTCVSNSWLWACIFYVVGCDLCCGIFLYDTVVYTIVQAGLIIWICDPYN
jgi:hypothetical protein